MSDYDVIVIGAGHAGIEAALASARMGAKTALLTLRAGSIGLMSCNPAIGGVGKGQLVKEIDALGGEMARAADACAIQFRRLNASKGAAVQSSRAQIDRQLYQRYMQAAVERQQGLEIIEAEVRKLIIEVGRVQGVISSGGEEILGKAVVLCPGTFLDGLMHTGAKQASGGRIDEPASRELAADLRSLGFNLLRFKTGTCPRLDKKSIDFSRLTIQEGDTQPYPFSFSTKTITLCQRPCHITYTSEKTHKIIRDNLGRSPLYAGVIKSTGVRYCPSIEDKIVKFSDKLRHQVFLEPAGLESEEIYPNGLSTSLPEDIQQEMVYSIEGLEEAKIIRFGYAIEHNVVEPTQLYPTLETKRVKNLYLAGQVNGTTGYEEAAAQGLVAGANAALRVKNKEPFILERSNSYIGVLIDDLTTKGTPEPYRMFTSRVEYRLILREDNADIRLSALGHKLGLVDSAALRRVEEKSRAIQEGISLLKSINLKPSEKTSAALKKIGAGALRKTSPLEEILKRPAVDLAILKELDQRVPDFAPPVAKGVEIEVKYSPFLARQLREVERFQGLEKIKLPPETDFSQVNGLSREIKEKLKQFQPLNLGQASRISGVTPAAISILMVYLRKFNNRA